MAQISYRANLSSAVFPMTLAKAGRTVINPGSDQNYDRRVDPVAETSDPGIPQAMYMENVLPTPNGFQSVGYVPGGIIAVGSSNVTGVVSARAPAEIINEFGVTYIDSGNNLTSWSYSTPLGEGGRYREVLQVSTIGSPPSCYEMRGESADAPGLQPMMNRQVDLQGSTSINFKVQFYFQPISVYQSCAIFACCDSTGAGIQAVFAGAGGAFGEGLLEIRTTTMWQTYGTFTQAATTAGLLTEETWYTFELNIVEESDTSKTIRATIYDIDGTTVLYTLTHNMAFTLGDYFGLCYPETTSDSPDGFNYYAMNWDNIIIQGNGIGFESELSNVVIAFKADQTARWSPSGVIFSNYVVSLPSDFQSPASQDEISQAFVRGIAFMAIKSAATGTMRIYTLNRSSDPGAFFLTEVTSEIAAGIPAPFSINDINSIVGSFNYLVLLSKSTVFWSSTTVPTDFSPSLVSGAGYEFVNNLKDTINFAKDHSAGFTIYTGKNAVFASYTGNARYPWKFREVQGSGGFTSQTQVSGDTNTAAQIGVTNTGQLQAIGPDSAELISKEVSDFFERSTVYDRYLSAGTGTFSIVSGGLKGPLGHYQAYIFLDRYILCPYGRVQSGSLDCYEYVLVFDQQLKRYGKLKINFNYIYCDDADIFFVEKSTGSISKLNKNIYETNGGNTVHSGFILFGKFQYVRSRFIQMERVELESSPNTGIIPIPNRTFVVNLIPTFDGKTLTEGISLSPVSGEPGTNLVAYNCHSTAQNFCLSVAGAFDLSDVELTFCAHGGW